MFLIRPAVAADRRAVVATAYARADWMRDRRLRGWATWMLVAESLGDQAALAAWPVWVLLDHDGVLVGFTTLQRGTPELGWDEVEQAESASYLQSTVTRPDRAGESLGTLLAFWALDHTFRSGRHWVRRNVVTAGNADLALVGLYRSQGWRVVRTVSHPRRSDTQVWALQRPARPQPDLTRYLVEAPHAVESADVLATTDPATTELANTDPTVLAARRATPLPPTPYQVGTGAPSLSLPVQRRR